MPDSSRHQPTIRVLAILERLAAASQGLSLTALAADTGFSKSTLFPIMKTLLARRYIRLDPDTLRYLWGVGGIALAGAGMAAAPWLSAINDEMRAVVQGCGEVCQMGVLEGRDILYVAKVEAKRQVRLLSQVGKRLPANCTALGKALLAQFDRAKLEEIFADGLPGFTARSSVTLDDLAARLEEVRRLGYAVDDRELHEETVCLAVALRQRGRPVAAISVSLPVFRAHEEAREAILGLLFTARERVEVMLAGLPELNFAED